MSLQKACDIKSLIKNNSVVIEFYGELIENSIGELSQRYQELDKKQKQSLIIDLSHVQYINSAGISLIINLLKEQQKLSKKLKIAGLSDYFKKLFKALGIDEYIEFYKNSSAATMS